MVSIRARLYSQLLRRTFRENGLGGGMEGLQAARAREDMGMGGIFGYLLTSKSVDATVKIGHMDAEWVGDAQAENTLLYLHGGGYVMGSIDSHRSLVRRLCRLADLRGLIIDYRLAPENPFPAAIEDAEAAYDFLTAEGVAPENMLLAGDSAGGGLSLALMQQLRSHDKAQPKAVALFSPWTDLTVSGSSHTERAERDPMIDISAIDEVIEFYCAEHDRKNPLISPLFADLTGFPPMLVQVGTEEVLFDDSTRLVDNALKAKVDAELQVWEGMPHVHQIAHALVPEAKAALRKTARFFAEKTIAG